MKADEMFPSKWLTGEDLASMAQVVTIKSLKQEEMFDRNEKAKVKKWVIYFKEVKKGLILNVTLKDQLKAVTGQDDTDGWPGQRVTIYPALVRGGSDEYLKVRIRKPSDTAAADPAKHWSADPAKLALLESVLRDKFGVASLADGLALLGETHWLGYATGREAGNAVERAVHTQQVLDIAPDTLANDDRLLNEYGIEEDDLEAARNT